MVDDNRGVNYSTCAITLTMATVFVGARMYCSIIKLGRWLYEDGILLVSLILLWTGSMFFVIATKHGIGRHIATLTEEEEEAARFNYLLCLWPAALAIGIPKIAVANLSCRIFTPGVWHRTIILSAAYIGVVNYLAVCLTTMLFCLPVASYWDRKVAPTRCLDTNQYLAFNFYAGVYSALLDFYLAVYPAFAFRGMPFISLSKKIGLSCVLGLGIFATTTACLKISYIANLGDLSDFTWRISPLMQWTIIEASVIITAACIPTLRPLFNSAREIWYQWFPNQRRTHSGPRVHVYRSHPSGSNQSSTRFTPGGATSSKDKEKHISSSFSWKPKLPRPTKKSGGSGGAAAAAANAMPDPNDDTVRIIGPKQVESEPVSPHIIVRKSIELKDLESTSASVRTDRRDSASPTDPEVSSEVARGGAWLADPVKPNSRCWH